MRLLFPLALLGLAGPVHAAEPRIETYDVRGSTYAELIASMRRNAPFVERTGQRHYGVTEVGFSPSWTFQPLSRGCELVSARVDLRLTMVLPRWVGRETADPALFARWTRLRDDIERHERLHADVALDYHRRLLDALDRPRTEATCERLNAVLTDEARVLVERHRNAQRAIDRGGRNPASSG